MVVFYSLLNVTLDSVTFNNWPSHLQIFDVCKEAYKIVRLQLYVLLDLFC